MMSMTPIRSGDAFSATAENRDRTSIDDGNEHGKFVARTTRPHRLGLNVLPVRRVQSKEDRITEDLSNRGQDRLPRPQRELDDGVEVTPLEVANLYLRTRCQAETVPTTGSPIGRNWVSLGRCR